MSSDMENRAQNAIEAGLHTYEQMCGEIESLQARIAELEAEKRDYRREFSEDREENIQLTKQLAASQLSEKRLRDACAIAEKTIHIVWVSHLANRCDHALELCRSALSLPTDTSALDAYVAEKVKEAGKFDMWKTNPYTKVLETSIEQLTKQRDLAVEALEKIAAPVRVDGTYNRCREACEILARETLSAIKESEAK